MSNSSTKTSLAATPSAPLTSGYDYWLARLDTGRINRGQLMLLFSESAEYVKVQMPTMKAELLVLEFMRRTPTQAEVKYFKALMTPVIDNHRREGQQGPRNQIKAIMATTGVQVTGHLTHRTT